MVKRHKPEEIITKLRQVDVLVSELLVVVIVEALDGRFRDGAIHAFDLTVGPGMLRPGRAMIDAGLRTGIFECMRPEAFTLRHGLANERHGRSARPWGRELGAVVGQNRVNFVGHGCQEAAEDVG